MNTVNPCRIVVAGGRKFNDYSLLWLELDRILLSIKREIEIVHGNCTGADTLAKNYAEANKIPVTAFPADWNRYGKSAGPRRNTRMSIYGDILIVFPGGVGTNDIINKMKELSKEVHIINYEES